MSAIPAVVTSSLTNAGPFHVDATNPGSSGTEVEFLSFTPLVDCVVIVRVTSRAQLVNSGAGSSSGISGYIAACVSEPPYTSGTFQFGQPTETSFDNLPTTAEAVFSLTGGIAYRGGLFAYVETSTSDAQAWSRDITIVVTESNL